MRLDLNTSGQAKSTTYTCSIISNFWPMNLSLFIPNDKAISLCNSISPPQIINLSTLSFNERIWDMRSLASFVVMLALITALETPQALPKAVLEGT